MKRGSEYAKRVKRLFQRLVRKYGKPTAAEPTEPLEQMLVSILASCATATKARAVFKKLRQQMVDLNELRVTPPMELAESIGDGVPLAREKAQRIVDVLNDVRRRQDTLDLVFLTQRGRREAREYLESLQGADRHSAACVVLHSLGGHAIPVDDLTLYILRKEELVDPAADAAEVQGFLERHVSAADTRAFVELLGRYVASRAPRVPVDRLGELLNPPPPPYEDEVEKKAATPGKARASRSAGKTRTGSNTTSPAKAKNSPNRATTTAKGKRKTTAGRPARRSRPPARQR